LGLINIFNNVNNLKTNCTDNYPNTFALRSPKQTKDG